MSNVNNDNVKWQPLLFLGFLVTWDYCCFVSHPVGPLKLKNNQNKVSWIAAFNKAQLTDNVNIISFERCMNFDLFFMGVSQNVRSQNAHIKKKEVIIQRS